MKKEGALTRKLRAQFSWPLRLSSRPQRQENLDVTRALWRGVEGPRKSFLFITASRRSHEKASSNIPTRNQNALSARARIPFLLYQRLSRRTWIMIAGERASGDWGS
jgi:hypothetical protein